MKRSRFKNLFFKIFIVTVFCLLISVSSLVSAKTALLSMGTGSSSGTYYYLGAGFAKIVEEYYPEIKVNAQPTAASFENLRLVASGDLDIGWACVGTASTLKEEGLDVSNLAMIGIGHRSDVHIMTMQDKYKTVKDLIGSGAKIAVGPNGSATKRLFSHFLLQDGLGLEEGVDYTPVYYSFSEAERGLEEGTVDVAITAAGFPLPGVIDMFSTHNVHFVNIPDDVLNKMVAKRKYIKPIIMPKETYPKMDGDVQTFFMRQTIVCKKDLPEDVVYKICKAIYGHPEEISAIHPQAKLWVPERAKEGIADELPVHPGALKYYKEIGVL
jgi:TRAP transporter TAXI family solute receptor